MGNVGMRTSNDTEPISDSHARFSGETFLSNSNREVETGDAEYTLTSSNIGESHRRGNGRKGRGKTTGRLECRSVRGHRSRAMAAGPCGIQRVRCGTRIATTTSITTKIATRIATRRTFFGRGGDWSFVEEEEE